MPRPSAVGLAAFVLLHSVLACSIGQAAPDGEQFFEEKVRPILVAKCITCHGPKKQESDLRLDARSMLVEGGLSGPAIVVGKPEESLLVEAVRRESLEMPPDEPLSQHDVEAIEEWIRIGAPWPASDTPPTPALGDQHAIQAAAKDHWAFQPLAKPEIPTVSPSEWVRTPTDAFVLARLHDAGLSPSEPVNRRALIRRAYYDVVGLPPSYEEIEAFVNDTSAEAFEKVVDRLLESKHYGERWGRHWLDLARYADTREWQAQADIRFPYAYTYRDWVIDVLNEDIPYDRFIKEQIAADFYTDDVHSPSLAALGFLTVGPRFRDNPFEQVSDRIDVVTRGLMALTVGCARCHDHKYDPVPTADYYSLAGVFASSEVPEELPVIGGGQSSTELSEDYQTKRGEKEKELKDYIDGLVREATADFRKRIGTYFDGYFDMGVSRKQQILNVVQKYKVKETAMTPLAANLDGLLRDRTVLEDPVWGPWAQLLKLSDQSFAEDAPKKIEELAANSDRFNPLVLEALAENPPQDKKQVLQAYAALFTRAEERWQETIKESPDAAQLDDESLEEVRGTLHADAGPFVFAPDAVANASKLLGGNRVILAKFENAVSEVDATHPGAPPRAMVISDKSQMFNPYVMLRGEPARRGPNVPRRFVSIVAGENAPPFTEGSGRKELAEAIASPDNPLTVRALVNRVWMELFGKGFVSTPGDFGLRSESPSHPELLDYLSVTFVEQNWSMKSLIRQIMLSSTYQQANDSRDQAAVVDPENRLLWRANRKRLDFEGMRDSMLATSGRIDLTVGGRSIQLFDAPYTTRRTLYGYIDRVEPDPIFKTFDAASPDASSPSRPQTTVPQQALFTMNHPFVIEQAQAVAKLDSNQSESPETRIDQIYQRLFGRKSGADELELARQFISTASAAPTPPAPTWQYGYGPYDPPSDAVRFTPLTHWTGRQYQYAAVLPDRTTGYLQLDKTGGHPGNDNSTAAIRRWVSPIDGEVTISGKLKHDRPKGDGIQARIVGPAGTVLGEWQVFQGETTASVKRVSVRRGDAIDFVLGQNANSNSDAFTWIPYIRAVDRDHQGQVWNARQQFAGPPPPPLEPWEQLAQALMMSNEFWFID